MIQYSWNGSSTGKISSTSLFNTRELEVQMRVNVQAAASPQITPDLVLCLQTNTEHVVS